MSNKVFNIAQARLELGDAGTVDDDGRITLYRPFGVEFNPFESSPDPEAWPKYGHIKADVSIICGLGHQCDKHLHPRLTDYGWRTEAHNCPAATHPIRITWIRGDSLGYYERG